MRWTAERAVRTENMNMLARLRSMAQNSRPGRNCGGTKSHIGISLRSHLIHLLLLDCLLPRVPPPTQDIGDSTGKEYSSYDADHNPPVQMIAGRTGSAARIVDRDGLGIATY